MWTQQCLAPRQPSLNYRYSLHRLTVSCGHYIFGPLRNEPRASCVVGEHSTDEPVVLLNHFPGVLDASCIELSVESLALVVVTYKSNTRRQRGSVL